MAEVEAVARAKRRGETERVDSMAGAERAKAAEEAMAQETQAAEMVVMEKEEVAAATAMAAAAAATAMAATGPAGAATVTAAAAAANMAAQMVAVVQESRTRARSAAKCPRYWCPGMSESPSVQKRYYSW